MSYIHEALKKAQVERDLGKGSYGGIPVLRRKKPFFTAKKTVVSGGLLLLVLLVFAGYSWWDLIRVKGDGGPVTIRRVNPPDGRSTSPARKHQVGPQQSARISPARPAPARKPLPAPATRQPLKNREDISESYQRAKGFHRDGRLPDAGLWYDKVISMDPGHVQALNNRGVLHLHQKDYPAARKYFEKAIRLKPDYVDPYYNLACLSAAMGRTNQGIRYLGKAVSMDPGVKRWAREDPDLDPLRELPRFKALVKKKQDQ